jgi:pimeloyl-ACP methyl ester carboxylesterase
MDIHISNPVPKSSKCLISLAALLLFAVPARGDDSSGWWKSYAANTEPVTLPDGKKLSLYCVGKGRPVVMMEAGLGAGGITSWRKVQTAIGGVTRACAYDRAGIWNSTATDGPRDAGAEADDLAALLKAAKLPAPYVIVAHSYGGYIARLYAGRHTQDVAGLLLIDPSSPHQTDRLVQAFPAAAKLRAPQPSPLKDCSVDPRPAEFIEKCQRAVPGDIPPDMADRYRNSQTPAAASAMQREGAAMALSSQLLDTEKKNLGAIPFVLLNRDPTMPFPEFAEDSVGAQRLWLQMHVETMDLSSASQLQVVPHAGHEIQIDRPDAVITAVTDMVLKVRRTGR